MYPKPYSIYLRGTVAIAGAVTLVIRRMAMMMVMMMMMMMMMGAVTSVVGVRCTGCPCAWQTKYIYCTKGSFATSNLLI